MTLSFDGRVLSICLGGAIYPVIASGDSWPSSYQIVVCPKTALPARFASSTVKVIAFEGFLIFDDVRLGSCEAVA